MRCLSLHFNLSANGYYSSFTYFASKILFDILPLRVVPPLVFGAIVYGWIGLVPEVAIFWKFMLMLQPDNCERHARLPSHLKPLLHDTENRTHTNAFLMGTWYRESHRESQVNETGSTTP